LKHAEFGGDFSGYAKYVELPELHNQQKSGKVADINWQTTHESPK